jgi:hypothetical protein
VLGDFLRGFWAPTFAAVILWLAWLVVTHVRREESKRRAFLRDRLQ